MKVFKNNNLSLILKPWGYGEKTYLHCGVIAGFHLIEGFLFSEQDIWQNIPPILGEIPLDGGMPKIQGEYLVVGHAYSPDLQPVKVMEVEVGIGKYIKKILVYGDRYWLTKGVGYEKTEPVSFIKMPLDYQHSYGGPNYPLNPIGKGNEKVMAEDGTEIWPLPNLELPDSLIVSPDDQVQPACFAPIPIDFPERIKASGTYDDRWQKERWPYFPEDMDYSFFNIAPKDQRIPDFFQGMEGYYLKGVSPSHPLITGSLPGIRPKLFLYKQKKLGRDFSRENLEFVEVTLKLDTVWFFPDILMGVLIYHGSSKILDDEYADLHRVYLTYHEPNEDDLTLEEYFKKMENFVSDIVDIDETPFKEAAETGEKMLIEWKRAPKKIAKIKDAIMGKKPSMVYTPEQTGALLKKVIEKNKKILEELEEQARRMHFEYGHMVEIDFGIFEHWKKTIPQMENTLNEMLKTAKEIEEKKTEGLDKARKKLDQFISRDNLLKLGLSEEDIKKIKIPDVDFDPDIYSLEEDPWQREGMRLVRNAKFYVEQNGAHKLETIGFKPETIDDAWIGYNEKSYITDAEKWGLELDNPTFEIPEGWVLPVFEEDRLVRIKIKTDIFSKDFYLVPGSEDRPIIYRCFEDKYPVVWVEDEIEGLFLEQEVGDFATILCNCNIFDLKDEIEELKEGFEILLISCEKNELAEKEFKKFKEVFEKSRIVSVPGAKDLFEYHKNGNNIRGLILSYLPEDFQKKHDVSIKLPPFDGTPFEFNINFPDIDLEKQIKAAVDECMVYMEEKKKALIKETQQRLNFAKSKIESLKLKEADVNIPDVDLEELFNRPPEGGKGFKLDKSPLDVGKEAIEKLKKQKEFLKDNPDAIKKIDQSIDKIKTETAKMDKEYKKLMALKDSLGKKFGVDPDNIGDLTISPPEDMIEEFKKHGMDISKMRPITRQEVIELHKNGESLNFYDLSNVDLSGLDLSGADFSMTNLENTSFKGSILHRARFYKIVSTEGADFSNADLNGANLEFMSIQDAKFNGAKMEKVKFFQVIVTKCDFSELDLSNSNLSQCIFQECVMDKSIWKGVRMDLSVIQKSIFTETDFSHCFLERCAFQEGNFKKTNFNFSSLPGVNFIQCQGMDVSFVEADLTKTSFAKENKFISSDFKNAKMKYFHARESDFSQSDFRGAVIKNGIFNICDLKKCDFTKTRTPYTSFTRCDLEGASMRGINLLSGSLKKSRLVDTDLSFANLYGVDFYKAVITGTRLREANLGLTLIKDREEFLDLK